MKAVIEHAKRIVQQKLKHHPKRLKHVYGVAQTAVQLARVYGVDEDAAMLAGLMHDCAKYDDLSLQQKDLDEQTIKRYQAFPVIFHALAAAKIIEQELDVHDETILLAVKHHVFGRPNMTMLEKIIYVADACEPNRPYQDIHDIYELATKNLDQAVLYCMTNSFDHLKRQGLTPSPESLKAYAYYKEVTRDITRNDR